MLAPIRTAAPADLPVSVVEAKAHLRVKGSGEDLLIKGLIAAATEHLDGWSGILGRVLVTQTWRQDFEGFCDKLRLPLKPVSAISEISYFDAGNQVQTLASPVYVLRTDALGPYAALKPNQSWPSAYGRDDAVSVTYVAGSAAADVPAPIRHAILLMVGHFYDNREAVVIGTISGDLPLGVDRLLAPYRRVM